MQRSLFLLALCSLFGTARASADCVVTGRASILTTKRVTVTGEISSMHGLFGSDVEFQGNAVHNTRLLGRRIGGITTSGPVVEGRFGTTKSIAMSEGRATAKRGLLRTYTFSWQPCSCTPREAALGAIHLTWKFESGSAAKHAQ